MDKHLLDLDALAVESFAVWSDDVSAAIGDQLNCTGCDSGCGIFPDP